MAQRFELVFLTLSDFHRIPGKLNTLPGSMSLHSGETRAPVYLTILTEACCGGTSSVTEHMRCRISRSSRTLVPCTSPIQFEKPGEDYA